MTVTGPRYQALTSCASNYDDESALKSAGRLVDSHDVELWHMDRPIARFDARSKQMCKK
jgi:hypothetical protein